MNTTPSPSRAKALDTSPPNDGGEDTPSAKLGAYPLPHDCGGEVARPEGETERGKPSRSRRKPGTTERARLLRQVENSAEGVLWQELKGRRLGGHHFTRQHPIGPYFADYCCRKTRLVAEIDGSQHADSAYDRRRDEFMRAQGYSVLRFWNVDVLKERTAVRETILAALEGPLAENIVATDLRFVYAADPLIKSQLLYSDPSSPLPNMDPHP